MAGVAKYLMGAVGHCSPPSKELLKTFPLACSRALTNLIRESTGFAAAATKMSVDCKVPEEAPPVVTTPSPPVEETIVEDNVVYPGTNVQAGPPEVVSVTFNIPGDGLPPS